jgi:hypothetical protein
MNINSINNRREANRMGLNTFPFGKYNIADSPIDDMIKVTRDRIKGNITEHEKWIEIETGDPQRFKDLNDIAEKGGYSLQEQMSGYIQEIIYLEEEILALHELKIIYAFKHLEINIKLLISAAYHEQSVSKMFKWENLIESMLSKHIMVKKFDSYIAVNQLRLVNNYVKHSNGVIPDENLKNIHEFSPDGEVTFIRLESFYKRVKNSPKEFLKELSTEIYNELYEFDQERIQLLTESLALRFDEEVAKNFCKQLLMMYEQK